MKDSNIGECGCNAKQQKPEKYTEGGYYCSYCDKPISDGLDGILCRIDDASAYKQELIEKVEKHPITFPKVEDYCLLLNESGENRDPIYEAGYKHAIDDVLAILNNGVGGKLIDGSPIPEPNETHKWKKG